MASEEQPIVARPNLSDTLASLKVGNYCVLGDRWAYGTIKQIASVLKVSISVREREDGYVVYRSPDKKKP